MLLIVLVFFLCLFIYFVYLFTYLFVFGLVAANYTESELIQKWGCVRRWLRVPILIFLNRVFVVLIVTFTGYLYLVLQVIRENNVYVTVLQRVVTTTRFLASNIQEGVSLIPPNCTDFAHNTSHPKPQHDLVFVNPSAHCPVLTHILTFFNIFSG